MFRGEGRTSSRSAADSCGRKAQHLLSQRHVILHLLLCIEILQILVICRQNPDKEGGEALAGEDEVDHGEESAVISAVVSVGEGPAIDRKEDEPIQDQNKDMDRTRYENLQARQEGAVETFPQAVEGDEEGEEVDEVHEEQRKEEEESHWSAKHIL